MLLSPVLSNSAAPCFISDLRLLEGHLLASIVKMASWMLRYQYAATALLFEVKE